MYISDCLGYAVLLYIVVCLTLLASFFLPSHLSLKHVSALEHIVSHLYWPISCLTGQATVVGLAE